MEGNTMLTTCRGLKGSSTIGSVHRSVCVIWDPGQRRSVVLYPQSCLVQRGNTAPGGAKARSW